MTVDPVAAAATADMAAKRFRANVDNSLISPSTDTASQSLRLAAEAERAAAVGSWEWLAANETTAWSPGLYTMFGRDPTAGSPLLADFDSLIRDEDRSLFQASMQSLVGHGIPYELQLRAQRADGFGFLCITRGKAEYTPNGRLFRLCGTFQDITTQSRIEAELRHREELYRSIIACSPLAILSIDLAGHVLTWNAAAERLFGWKAVEVIGKTLPIVSPGDQQEFAELRAIVSSGQSFSRREVVRHNRLGQPMDVSISAAPIRDATHRVVGIMASLENITQRKQVESALRQLNATLEQRVAARTRELEAINKELEAFSYSVSHDLRAPLRAIDGWAQALAEDYADTLDEAGRHMLQRQRAASQRMALLIDDLLSLSRLSRHSLTMRDVSLASVVDQAWNELTAQWNKSQVPELVVGELPCCQGDVGLLQQLLVNLLSNALKFTAGKSQPRVEVGCQATDSGELAYFVRDNGVGFDMRYVDKLFHAFQRLHSGDEFPGTGIGLAIVQRIVNRHGGRVWAEGRVDHGATIYFTLPQKTSPAPNDEQPEPHHEE